MWILGYGEYQSLTESGIFWETLPFWLERIILALLWYIACSVLMERGHYKSVLVITLALTAWGLPMLQGHGAWGPRHVAMATGLWAWPILVATLLIKGVLLTRKTPDVTDTDEAGHDAPAED